MIVRLQSALHLIQLRGNLGTHKDLEAAGSSHMVVEAKSQNLTQT